LKKVLFDSDVLLDVLLNRHPFIVDSAQALNTVATEQIKGYLAGHAVTNLYYIMRRQLNSAITHKKLNQLLQRIEVASVTDNIIRSALQNPMPDFEDAVTSEAAYAAQIDLIVTRNISDFEKSPVFAILPGKLIEMLSNEA
jgi:predicted nucleic acid-binding protein